jgi:hypothetical protein
LSKRTIVNTKRNSTNRTGESGSGVPSEEIHPRSKQCFSGAAKRWRPFERSSPRKSNRGPTVITLLADANIQGQVALLAAYMQAEPWRDFWDYLDLRLLTFADVGLNPSDPDDIVWQRCQELSVLLITDNRNDDGLDSLEATIRRLNTPEKLPVFHYRRHPGGAVNPRICRSGHRPVTALPAGNGQHPRLRPVVRSVSR